MTNSRHKGASGERELFKLLGESLGIKVERNLSQTRDGGYDTLVGDFCVECKRAEVLCLPEWWRQTVTQANASGKRPMLIYRPSRHPWRVRVTGADYVALNAFNGSLSDVATKLATLHALDDIIELDLPAAIRLIRLTLNEGNPQ